MVSEIKLEFPEFITHIPVSKNKWVKIGYNKIHASVHYTTRAALVAAMHGYIEKHIPNNLTIKAPVETKLTVYAPVNYGVMKMIKDKVTDWVYIWYMNEEGKRQSAQRFWKLTNRYEMK